MTRLVRGIIAFMLGFTIMLGLMGTRQAFSMAGQFGTYSQAYIDRQKCKADPKCKPFCYRGGRLCDCKTHVCEGENR